MLRTGQLFHLASTPAFQPNPEASLPRTLASPRTGLAPAGYRGLPLGYVMTAPLRSSVRAAGRTWIEAKGTRAANVTRSAIGTALKRRARQARVLRARVQSSSVIDTGPPHPHVKQLLSKHRHAWKRHLGQALAGPPLDRRRWCRGAGLRVAPPPCGASKARREGLWGSGVRSRVAPSFWTARAPLSTRRNPRPPDHVAVPAQRPRRGPSAPSTPRGSSRRLR